MYIAKNIYMEQTIKILIYIHAFFGGIGLLMGILSVLVKKGGKQHKRFGKIFSYAILISAFISLIVAQLPNHENLFLFLIGVFTIYMVLAGNRAITFKKKSKTSADMLDKLISGTMCACSILMLIVGIIGELQHIGNSILYIFFGAFGLLMTLKDFRMYRNIELLKLKWQQNHLGKMIGALIASVTAFIIAGLNMSTLIFWILPTIIGSLYIIYWNRKLAKQ